MCADLLSLSQLSHFPLDWSHSLSPSAEMFRNGEKEGVLGHTHTCIPVIVKELC